MEAIRDYFNNLASFLNNGAGLEGDAVLLSHKKSSNMTYLVINRLDYITQVLIHFFFMVFIDNLRKNWTTKIEK